VFDYVSMHGSFLVKFVLEMEMSSVSLCALRCR
jgi:hypothetical protein